MVLVPDHTFADAPPVDILVVPGGPGVNQLLDDQVTLAYIRKASREAHYTTSVCTGALVLGAAGLLKGRKATTHWMAREFLASFGAEVVHERVVVDGTLVTGGGVTAGIDFALRLVMEIAGWEVAERIQLLLEYDPQPPLEAGSPESAGEQRIAEVREMSSNMLRERMLAVERAFSRLRF
jgi:cyclohexyl-isocyanide hydratase